MNINSNYLEKEVKERMGEFFQKEGYIQLKDFISKDSDFKLIEKSFLNEEFEKNYSPLTHKNSVLDIKKTFNPEILQLVEFFKSEVFLEFLEESLEIDLDFKEINILKYSHRDFEIISDLEENHEELNVYFDLTRNWKKEFGGTLTYTTEDEEIFYLEPDFNTLNIIFKPREIYKYLKYINNKCKDKKIIRIEIKYKID